MDVGLDPASRMVTFTESEAVQLLEAVRREPWTDWRCPL